MSEQRQFRRRGLGRGLDALLSTGIAEVEPDDNHLVLVDPSEVGPNPEQPRRDFDEHGLRVLADSIRLHGLLQPIVVQRRGDGGYTLVAGERRLRAAQLASITAIPAIVRPATESDRQALELALTENLLRTDLSPLEEAAAYARLADTFGLSHEAIGLRVGRSRPAIANSIRLLALAVPVQRALAEGRLTVGHVRALLPLPTDEQEAWARRIEAEGWTTSQVESRVNSHLGRPPKGARRHTEGPAPTPDEEALRRGFEDAVGMPVTIHRRRRGGGRIIVEFADDSDLDALYRKLGGAEL